jgi:CheY-like chemotaxis protein/anti-sigma regulatory factor (Ser/Thr protein kinase)
MREANAELERASRLKSEFLATMSHEIRTPLNGVLGLADLLLATPLDAQQREYATALRSAGDTLLALVNDVLDLSKIEAGHFELESQPFDPRQLVGEVIETLLPPAEAKGLVVASRVEPEVPALLRGDPVRLRQVLTNLVANAVKFTERGDVTVWVRPVEWADGRATVEMAVSDTGIGIPPEALPHLFDAFTQADATTTRRYGGTGLGLAIAKRLVEAMGGQIRVDSAVGQGSTFWVTVCLPVEAVGALARVTSEGPPTRAGPLATGRDVDAATVGQPGAAARRVLVAEDNPVSQLVARGLLAGLGYAVEVVADGQQAVAALGHGQYDLVLMDCQMPVMDGYAAAAEIRRQEGGGRRTPIVAITAHALAGEAEKCRAAGMDDYVAKPVTAERLAAVVARWTPAAGAGRPNVALDPSVIAMLRELEQGQPGLLARMVGLYLRDARTQLAALRQAAEYGDAHELEEAAHSLKGGSAQIGATAMVALCRDLETAAQAADSSRVVALVATLERAFDQVWAALAALPEAAGPGPAAGTDAQGHAHDSDR